MTDRYEQAPFKVGTKLVAKAKGYPDKQIFEVERIGFKGELYDTRWRLLNVANLREATPEEIRLNTKMD